MNEILIRNVYHLATFGQPGERLSNVDVLVRQGRIALIGKDLERSQPVPPGVAARGDSGGHLRGPPGPRQHPSSYVPNSAAQRAALCRNVKLF